MKKLLLLLILLGTLPAVAQKTDNGWEAWQKTSCYGHIEFRLKQVKKQGDRYVWNVQFKNNYPQLISFSYQVTDELGEYSLTTHRKTLEKGQVSNEFEVFTSTEDIYIVVDRVSFSPYPENFVDCDQ